MTAAGSAPQAAGIAPHRKGDAPENATVYYDLTEGDTGGVARSSDSSSDPSRKRAAEENATVYNDRAESDLYLLHLLHLLRPAGSELQRKTQKSSREP